MYQNKFVVAIKANGQILREQDGSVRIPFGSEYAVLVKNLNPTRAKFKLDIDGKNQTSDTWIVVPANASVTIERSIEHGNWETGRRFKFIERTAEVEAHRGVRMDDGLVRVEYQVEVVRPVMPVPHYEPYPVPTPYPDPWYPKRWPYFGRRRDDYGRPLRPSAAAGSAKTRSASLGSRSLGMNVNSAFASGGASATMNSAHTPTSATSDIGITVAGSQSDQKFHAADWFQTGNSEVMVLRLVGMMAGQPVSQPVTVNTELVCSSCGKTSSSRAEFCDRCGTALVA